MTNMQILIVNLVASFLPWVLPAPISIVILSALGIYSVYSWYKTSPHEPLFAYVALGLMTILTSIDLFLFEQYIAALYSFIFFSSISFMTMLGKEEEQVVAELLPVSTMTNADAQVSTKDEVSTSAMMHQMDRYFDQLLSVVISMASKAENMDRQLFLRLDEMQKSFLGEMGIKYDQMAQEQDSIKKLLEQQFKGIEGVSQDLLMALQIHQVDKEYLESELKKLKESQHDTDQSQVMAQIIQHLQEKGMKMTNSRHVKNQELKNLFYRALKESNSEICIISPWLGGWLVKDNVLMKQFEAAIRRGVDIKIVYGISYNSAYSNSDKRDQTSKSVAKELRKKWSNKGYSGKIKIQESNTHYKLLISDDLYYVETSYNLLSNQGKFDSGNMWHEGGTYSEDTERIALLKSLYFSF